MSKIINGSKIAREINNSVRKRLNKIYLSGRGKARLVSLTTSSGPDAEIYVNMQKKAAESIGIEFVPIHMKSNISQASLIKKIDLLNSERRVTAIIVQKPLPKGVNHDAIIARIRPEKDAEGIHPYNLGRLLRKQADIVPCTPGAVMKILEKERLDLYGKEVVIIGHSAIVGKPLSLMMLNETATTTVCHIGTAQKGDLLVHTRKADILVVAVGSPEMVKGSWVKKGAIVIDVGINKIKGKIVGDVKFSEAIKKARMITPVPGGVGPVTVSILMRNVLRAYRRQNVSI